MTVLQLKILLILNTDANCTSLQLYISRELNILNLFIFGVDVLHFGFECYVGRKRKGTVVAPSAPKTEAGLYWGYATRLAANLSAVFTQSPYDGGYDLIIGTSEHGTSIDNFVLTKFK